jgi:hypothetical protein
MSVAATATVTSLLTSLGFDQARLNKACDSDELVVDTFDGWRNPQISTDSPARGCISFRDLVPDAIVA